MRMRVLLPLLMLVVLAAPVTGAPRVRFGIHTPPQGLSYEQVRDLWAEAERLGYESAWLFDHFMPIFGDEDGPVLEGWTTLAALATQPSRLRIGLLVTGNTYRNPALLAKMATTVDHISGGRLVLGIGAGWFEREHEAYGFHFGTARERAAKLDEALQVIRKLWTEDHPSFRGKYYSLERAPFAPANVQRPHPPIVIGGQGKQWIVPQVARWADGWNVPPQVTPDGIRERRALIEAECRKIGRLPCPAEVSVMLPLASITNVPLAGPALRLGARLMVDKAIAQNVLAGSADDIRDRIRAYVDAGVTEVILSVRPPADPALLRQFATEVMPGLRGDAAGR